MACFSITQIILWSSTNIEWSLYYRKEQLKAKWLEEMFLHEIIRGSLLVLLWNQ